MLTNVIRNFNDRLREYVNGEGRHLPGIIFHTYLLSILPIKLSLFSYKLCFISVYYLRNYLNVSNAIGKIFPIRFFLFSYKLY